MQIEEVGRSFCLQYKGTLSFSSCRSNISLSRITAFPSFQPTEPHNFESIQNENKRILDESLSASSLTPLTQEESTGREGCLEMLLYGMCNAENCSFSHQQTILEKTCEFLLQKLLESKYNNAKSNDEDLSSFIIEDDDIDNERPMIRKRKVDELPSIEKKLKKDKMIFPPKVKNHDLYRKLHENDCPAWEIFTNKTKIDESNLLTKETWISFSKRLKSDFPRSSNTLLMIGAPQKAEVEIIQKNMLLLNVLEYR